MLLVDYYVEIVKGWYDMVDEELKNSFGIEYLIQFLIEYIDFCKKLFYYYLEDDFIVVYVGLDFSQENLLIENKELLWIRDWYDKVNYDWF